MLFEACIWWEIPPFQCLRGLWRKGSHVKTKWRRIQKWKTESRLDHHLSVDCSSWPKLFRNVCVKSCTIIVQSAQCCMPLLENITLMIYQRATSLSFGCDWCFQLMMIEQILLVDWYGCGLCSRFVYAGWETNNLTLCAKSWPTAGRGGTFSCQIGKILYEWYCTEGGGGGYILLGRNCVKTAKVSPTPPPQS